MMYDPTETITSIGGSSSGGGRRSGDPTPGV